MIVLLLIIAIIVGGLLFREDLFPSVLAVSMFCSVIIAAFCDRLFSADLFAISLTATFLACESGLCLLVLPGRTSLELAHGECQSAKGSEWFRITRFALIPSLVLALIFILWHKFSGSAFMEASGSVKSAHLMLLSACLAFGTSTAGAALALWLQDYSLRKKKYLFNGALLPSVTISDLSSYRLVGGTFILLTMAFVPALFMVRSHWGGWLWEVRTAGGILLWVSYGLAFHLRKKAQLNGVKFALLPLMALVLFLAVMFFTGGGMR